MVEVPDPTADRFGPLVRDTLDVTAALVFRTADDQFPPDTAGVWLARRAVQTGEPVVVNDLGRHELTRQRAFSDGSHIAAGLAVPVQDGTLTVGALCALDAAPRAWTERDIHVLTGLAAACSAELSLRRSHAEAAAQQQRAETAWADAEQRGEQARLAQHRSELVTVATLESEQQARLLLALSEALAVTTTVASVVKVVEQVAAENLGVETTQIVLGEAPAEDRPGGPWLRLPLSGGVRGTLALGWSSADSPWTAFGQEPPGPVQERIREALAALVQYTSTALERAILLEERRDTATTLQHALLTTLPERDDVHLAARYLPAASANQVGGDWYDAVALPTEPGGGPGDLAVIIGDIAGHDIEAAATMGQIRSLLRGLLVDRPQPPAEVMTRLDAALTHLRIDTGVSAVLAILCPSPDRPGAKRLHWANAGHPPPLRVTGAGVATLLTPAPDLLLGMPFHLGRTTHELDLDPGDTLILHTDGLVQRAGRRISQGQESLLAAAREHHRLELPELLDRLLSELVDEGTDDDCAILAVRLPS
ncbi:GAF domain-containing SpoIIE family protein phosphatase [Kineosporia sp. NBRC 101677]|uniref:GAF domain-containing SpoIIE family protein phosphatase n=1 Tax=Kineosporia sp. NBRC 101677 TaxID=3032197 RepID=UPI0025560EA3|nr:GAF domain-containing SpoIIE family protein phosphatase [Kineosporia sp. NBRC 101677]